VIGAEQGVAMLSPDGSTLTFTPTPGYVGAGKADVQAGDGYGTSRGTPITLNVSGAPLVELNLPPPAVTLPTGEWVDLTVVGDFTDQHGVPLPPSYLAFASADPSVATIDAAGHVVAVADGTTVLTVSHGALQAATAVGVTTPDPDAEEAFTPFL